MPIRIAVITDTHFAENTGISERKGDVADILLTRAVHRLNREIKPDVTALLGDILNDGDAEDAPVLRRKIREVIDRLESQVIVIPGNHDGDIANFYKDFPDPGDFVDVKGYRFVPFIDQEEPMYNARRSESDLERMKSFRNGFEGPIITLQHTSIFPPGTSESPYNYTNVESILSLMKSQGVSLAISGHYHPGVDLIRSDSGSFLIAPALCETPFSFLVIDIDGDDITVARHNLQMPPELGLIDYHVHTPFAYCSENMSMPKALELARIFGLAGLSFTEHSGQLYFNSEDYWSNRFLDIGLDNARPEDNRTEQFFDAVRPYAPPAMLALEADCDFSGRPVVMDRDRERVEFLVGAIHALPELMKDDPDLDVAANEYLAALSEFAKCGIVILAHPLRVFRRSKRPAPLWLHEPVVRLLKENDVAAEVNFHTNEPPVEFFTMCIRAGVKLSFGSDSHNLYEVGEFSYHLKLLRDCGFDGDVSEILLNLMGDREPL